MYSFLKTKTLIVALVCCSFFWSWRTLASSLNYHDFLLFFRWGLELDTPAQLPVLQYSNLSPSDPLYPFLQKAVAYGYFPNYSGALPLNELASQKNLNELINYAFWLSIPTKQDKNLTFESLQSQIQLLKPAIIQTKSYAENHLKSQIATILEEKYLYPEKLLPLSLLNSTGITNYISQIEDPYLAYYSPQDAKLFLAALENNRAGIGVALSPSNEGYPEVMRIISWSSAAQAGLQVWDQIIQVDEYDFDQERNFEQFVARIRGEKWTQVTIKVKRNQTILSFSLERQKIALPLVSSFNHQGKCYIRIEGFDRWSSDQFFTQAKNLGVCTSLAIDLGDNPWWIVDEVVDILSSFVSENQLLISLEKKSITEYEYSKKSDFSFPGDLPIMLLINKSTASASEILTAVLKYYFPERVTIIGTASYWKWTMQEVVELSDHSLLKYTLALRKVADQNYSINKTWIIPDQELLDDPKTPQDELLDSLGLTQ